jgi:hypothetical protein
MNYKNIYQKLITKTKLEDRKKSDTVYYEAHHIKPKSFGGEGDCRNINHPNIVLLTPKEHYIAHLLLVNIYPNSPAMHKALWNMCNVKKNVRYKPSAKTYCAIRKEYIKNTIGSNNHFFGKTHSDESKLKISIKAKGRQTFLGKTHSKESKLKIKESKLGKAISEETKNKIKFSMSGGNHYNAKTVICTKSNLTFGSGKELSEHLNKPFSTIRAYLNGRNKVPNWFHYKRIES